MLRWYSDYGKNSNKNNNDIRMGTEIHRWTRIIVHTRLQRHIFGHEHVYQSFSLNKNIVKRKYCEREKNRKDLSSMKEGF